MSASLSTQKLKKSSLDVLDEFREIFGLVDKDGSGSISREELGELFEIIGIQATSEEIGRMVAEVDIDSNGEIDFEEFAEIMSTRVHTSYSSEEVKDAFRIFQDYTGASPGRIHVDKLAEYLTTYGDVKLPLERAKELVAQLETDQNGMADYTELIDMMMHW